MILFILDEDLVLLLFFVHLHMNTIGYSGQSTYQWLLHLCNGIDEFNHTFFFNDFRLKME